jgi:hypothetical protein
MNSGVLATGKSVPETVHEFDRIASYSDGEFREILKVNQEYKNLSNKTIGYFGEAAIEKPVSREETVVDDSGNISTETTQETVWNHTEFLLSPGEFVVIGNSDGLFLTDLIGQQADTMLERASVNLDAYLKNERSEASTWKYGFFGRDQNARKGTIYGDDLLDDGDIGRVLIDNSINQVGLTYERNGQQMKTSVTRSGYVEVYQPSEFDDVDYIEYLSDEISPYIRVE